MENGNIRIIVDRSMDMAEEFAEYLKTQGYNASLEPEGRHTQGKTVIITEEPLYEEYEGPDDFVNSLWADFTNN